MYKCINCGEDVADLCTKYSCDVYKLNVCENCNKVVDKYIEYDEVIVFWDLLVQRKSAYRHILNNVDINITKFLTLSIILDGFSAWFCLQHLSTPHLNLTFPTIVSINLYTEIFLEFIRSVINVIIFVCLSFNAKISCKKFSKVILISNFIRLVSLLVIPWNLYFPTILSSYGFTMSIVLAEFASLLSNIIGIVSSCKISLYYTIFMSVTSTLVSFVLRWKMRFAQEFIVLILLGLINLAYSINYKVSTSLETYWSQTDVDLEALEYVATGDINTYWHLIDAIALQRLETRQSILDHITSSLFGTKNSDERRLFNLVVNSRTFSPRVALDNTIARSCFNGTESGLVCETPCPHSPTWAKIGATSSKFVCKLEELNSVLLKGRNFMTDSTEGILNEDKISKSIKDEQTFLQVVLYADLHDASFSKWHDSIKNYMSSFPVIYILRNYKKDLKLAKNPMQGYGVELVLKSTEYKAMDDSSTENKSSEGEAQASIELTPENAVQKGLNFSTLLENHPEHSSQLRSFYSSLLDEAGELRSLKKWQVRQLSIQAAQRVMKTTPDKRLEALKDICQNFPSRSMSLVNIEADPSFIAEIEENQVILQAKYEVGEGQNALFINGIGIPMQTDIFTLMEHLRLEHSQSQRLQKLGYSVSDLQTLLSTQKTTASLNLPDSVLAMGVPNSPPKLTQLAKYSASGHFALDMSSAPVSYFNCLESNAVYTQWPSTLRALFQPSYMGGLKMVSRNVVNLVLVIDLSDSKGMEWLRLTEAFLLNKIPIRLGLLAYVKANDDVSLMLARAFHHLSQLSTSEATGYDRRGITRVGFAATSLALSFLTDLATLVSKKRSKDPDFKLVVDDVFAFFGDQYADIDAEAILQGGFGESPVDQHIKKQQEFLENSGLVSVDDVDKHLPMMLMNGMPFTQMSVNKMGSFEDAVFLAASEFTNFMQIAFLQTGNMDDSITMHKALKKNNILLTHLNVPLIRHFTSSPSIDSNENAVLDLTFNTTDTMKFLEKIPYISKFEYDVNANPITYWLVIPSLEINLDGTNEENLKVLRSVSMLRDAFNFVTHSKIPTRLTWLFNPKDTKASSCKEWPQTGCLNAALSVLGKSSIAEKSPIGNMPAMTRKNLLRKIINLAVSLSENPKMKVKELDDYLVSGVNKEEFMLTLRNVSLEAMFEEHHSFLKSRFNLSPGEKAIIINGKVFGPLSENQLFTKNDFILSGHLIDSYDVIDVVKALKHIKHASSSSPDLMMEMAFRTIVMFNWMKGKNKDVLQESVNLGNGGSSGETPKRHQLNGLYSDRSIFVTKAGEDKSSMWNIVAIVSPASSEAQKLTQWLLILHRYLGASVTVVLNPKRELSELPLKRYYRFVWEPSMSHPNAEFEQLPSQSLFTLGLDTPNVWMVSPAIAKHDLDNIKLANHALKSDDYKVNSVYRLDYLLLEGHCVDQATGQPPRGLQFDLGDDVHPQQHDTIVMANLVGSLVENLDI